VRRRLQRNVIARNRRYQRVAETDARACACIGAVNDACIVWMGAAPTRVRLQGARTVMPSPSMAVGDPAHCPLSLERVGCAHCARLCALSV
jgi:hypothetical protein